MKAPASILVIDDDSAFGGLLTQQVRRLGHGAALTTTLSEGMERAGAGPYDVVLLDVNLPDGSGLEAIPFLKQLDPAPEIIIITGQGDSRGAELAIQSGAWDYLSKSASLDALRLSLTRAIQYREGKKAAAPVVLKTSGMIGGSAPYRKCLEDVARAAAGRASVLIRGETGTGKELFARALHFGSTRREEPFIEVNCSAIPPQLLESELFGHERGAFTDAKERKIGLIERANGGTFFLDEIGDMDFNLQAKILRVLEDRAIRRVGGDRKIPVDIRFIAATHKNLDEMIAEHVFREDLYFRLNVIAIDLPPLRERADDVVVLAGHFLEQFCREHSRSVAGFAPEALAALKAYHWPGNVRELRNSIERAVLIEAEERVEAEHLHLWRRRARREGESENGAPRIGYDFEIPDEGFSLVEFEKVIIARAMKKARWNVSKAARLLGLSRETMRYRLKKHELQGE